MRKNIIVLLGLFIGIITISKADSYVRNLDLTKHASTDNVKLKKLNDNDYQWTLPNPIAQTINLDFDKLKINPKDYDELRFDIKPEGSLVGLHTVIHGFPEEGKLSSWYLKFKTPVGKWTSGRYELRVDDDGIFIPRGTTHLRKNIFTMKLSRRVTGTPNEPKWRKVTIRNPRLIKYRVTCSVDWEKTELTENEQEIYYTYYLNIKNMMNSPVNVQLDLDSMKTLKYFTVEGLLELKLKAKEEKVLPVKIAISRSQAESLPSLYSEPCLPKICIPDIADSDFSPIISFRNRPLWGVVPILNKIHPSPAETMAFLAARENVIPGIKKWKKNVLRVADKALTKVWPIYKLLTAYDQKYRCKACNITLKPIDETKIDKHICPKCKKIFKGNRIISLSYATRYRSARFKDIWALALAYQFTGFEKYAKKSIDMLKAYADIYQDLPIKGWRSTSGASKLGSGNTLSTSWLLPKLAEAYHNLKASEYLDKEKQKAIKTMLIEEGIRVARHSVEYSNMQAEHIRAFGSVGIVTGFYPLVGEAIFGDYGWHELVKNGFSKEGVGHESGVYHRALFGAMVQFANFAYGAGVNLLTPSFKRVFDGSIVVGITKGAGISYELAYRIYRDPAYLAVLKKSREKTCSYATAFLGISGLATPDKFPVKSKLFTGTGYIFLKKGNATDSHGIVMNYIKSFDRLEYDKFQTRFYRNSKAVDGAVGRISYAASEENWMYSTAAHNTIVINAKDQRDVDAVLLAFDDSSKTPFAVSCSDDKGPFYKGVYQLRGIALLDNCYIVFDQVRCDKASVIDRFQYGIGPAKLNIKNIEQKDNLLKLPKYGNFKNIIGGLVQKYGDFKFKNGLKGRIICDSDFYLYKATTIKGYQPNPCDVVFARVVNHKHATFLAGFVFGQQQVLPELKIIESNNEKLLLAVKTEQNSYKILVNIKMKQVSILQDE